MNIKEIEFRLVVDLTDEQRRHYFNNPEQIIGKQVTIQYFETTKNKRGEESLRFPVMKCIYEGIRDF